MERGTWLCGINAYQDQTRTLSSDTDVWMYGLLMAELSFQLQAGIRKMPK